MGRVRLAEAGEAKNKRRSKVRLRRLMLRVMTAAIEGIEKG